MAVITTIVALTAEGRLFVDLNKWWLVVPYSVRLGLRRVAARFLSFVYPHCMEARRSRSLSVSNWTTICLMSTGTCS